MLWLAALIGRGWVDAQWRALVVLTGSLHAPLVSTWGPLTGAPTIRQVRIAGVPSTVATPAGGGRHPAVVFLNGATAAGRFEPHVVRLTQALGRAGFVTVVPDPPGLKHGEITPRTLAGIAAVTQAVERMPDVSHTGLLGVSVGCSLGLDAAEDGLAHGLSTVACIAPFVNLRSVVELAFTGSYPEQGGKLLRYPHNSFVALVAARSLAESLPVSPAQSLLVSELLAIGDNAPHLMARIAAIPMTGLSGPAAALLRLADNRSTARFPALYDRLPADVRDGIAQLSPITHAEGLKVPVEIISGPHDSYFPLAQYPPLLHGAPDVQLTVSSVLQHAVPKPTPSNIGGIAHLDGFAVGALRRFAGPVPLNWLAVVVSLAAIGLVAAEGFAHRRGLVALGGAVALLLAAPALYHPLGVPPALVASLVIVVVTGAVAISSGRSYRRKTQ